MELVVEEIFIEENISNKTNKPYYQFVIGFKSGYVYRCFLNDEQKFAMMSSGIEIR